jgi:hypothetical protein
MLGRQIHRRGEGIVGLPEGGRCRPTWHSERIADGVPGPIDPGLTTHVTRNQERNDTDEPSQGTDGRAGENRDPTV